MPLFSFSFSGAQLQTTQTINGVLSCTMLCCAMLSNPILDLLRRDAPLLPRLIQLIKQTNKQTATQKTIQHHLDALALALSLARSRLR